MKALCRPAANGEALETGPDVNFRPAIAQAILISKSEEPDGPEKAVRAFEIFGLDPASRDLI